MPANVEYFDNTVPHGLVPKHFDYVHRFYIRSFTAMHDFNRFSDFVDSFHQFIANSR